MVRHTRVSGQVKDSDRNKAKLGWLKQLGVALTEVPSHAFPRCYCTNSLGYAGCDVRQVF